MSNRNGGSDDSKSAFGSSAFIVTTTTIASLVIGGAAAFFTSLIQSGYFPEGSDSGKLAAAILAGLMFVGAGIASASYVVSNAWRKNVDAKAAADVTTAREKTKAAQFEQNAAVTNLEVAKTNLVATKIANEPAVVIATDDDPPTRIVT